MVAMLYVPYPLSLRNVQDLAFERGIDICQETVRKGAAASADVLRGDAPANPQALAPGGGLGPS